MKGDLDKRFYSSNLFKSNKISFSLKQFSFKCFKGTGFFYKHYSNEYYFITSKHIIFPIENQGDLIPKYSQNMVSKQNIVIYDKDKDSENLISIEFLGNLENWNRRLRKHNTNSIDIILSSINELFNNNPITKDEIILYNMKTLYNYFIFTKENISNNECISNEDVCIIGFPETDRGKYPTIIEAKIISNNNERIIIDKTIPKMLSGSPAFLSKSIRNFNNSQDFNDIKLVGIVFGHLINRNKEGLILNANCIEEVINQHN